MIFFKKKKTLNLIETKNKLTKFKISCLIKNLDVYKIKLLAW